VYPTFVKLCISQSEKINQLIDFYSGRKIKSRSLCILPLIQMQQRMFLSDWVPKFVIIIWLINWSTSSSLNATESVFNESFPKLCNHYMIDLVIKNFFFLFFKKEWETQTAVVFAHCFKNYFDQSCECRCKQLIFAFCLFPTFCDSWH